MMVKKLFRQSLCSFFICSGIFRFTKALSSRLGKKALVLCYHRVVIGPPDSYSAPGTQLELDNFRFHLAFLLRHYKVIRLSDLIKELVGGKELSERNYAVLTFDDGFGDGYTNIFPLLKQFAIPATFFVSPRVVTSGFLSWHDELWYYLSNVNGLFDHLHFENLDLPVISVTDRLKARAKIVGILSSRKPSHREELLLEIKTSLGLENHDVPAKGLMLGQENLLEMASSGLVEWGAHSMSHPMLSLCTEDEAEMEIGESKTNLESLLTCPVDLFAYPFGKYNHETVTAVQRCGYKAAVTTNEGLVKAGDDLFLLNRLNVFRDDTFASLATQKIMRFYVKQLLGLNKLGAQIKL